jgi:polar amino acid transport system substrate-binding protein
VAVDKPGIKIGTIRDAPSDRILTTEIKSAEIVRIPLSPHIAADAAEMLRTGIAGTRAILLRKLLLARR